MKEYRKSFSIICSDLLNVRKTLIWCEDEKMDYVHFDIADTSFTQNIMLSPVLLKQIKEHTKIPIDLHVMINRPEIFLSEILPYLGSEDIVSVHIEATKHLFLCLNEIKSNKCKAGVAMNLVTSIDGLKYVSHLIDEITILQGNAGSGIKHDSIDKTCMKIADTKGIFNSENVLISIDGNVGTDNMKTLLDAGANMFVLGNTYLKDLEMKAL